MSSNERVRGVQVHRSIIYGSVARLLTPEERALAPPDHTHRWTIFLTSAAPSPTSPYLTLPQQGSSTDPPPLDHIPGGGDNLGYLIKKVTFKLHETIPNPNRVVDKPPFQVTETGWGEFAVPIKIQFVPEASEKPITITHSIRLHHWGPPVEVVHVPASQPQAAAEGTEGAAGSGGIGPKEKEGEGDVAKKGDDSGPGTDGDVKVESAEQRIGPSEKEVKNGSTDVEIPAAGPIDTNANTAEGSSTAAATPATTAETPAAPTTSTSNPDASRADNAPTETAEPPPVNLVPVTPLSIATRYPVHAWQYDELVFNDPLQSFLTILNNNTQHGLPGKLKGRRDQREDWEEHKRKRGKSTSARVGTTSRPGSDSRTRSALGSLSNPANDTITATTASSQISLTPLSILPISEKDRLGIPGEPGSADVPLEFSTEMEKAEHNRLADARIKIIQEMDMWRERLIAREKELEKLKKAVGK